MKRKIRLEKTLLCLLIIILGFFSHLSSANAAVYHVKNGGDDKLDGLSDKTAWATISKVNTFARSPRFSDGDEIHFKRGSTFDDATLGRDGVSTIDWGFINRLTFRDYGVGEKPKFDGNAFQPVYFKGGSVGDDGTVSSKVKNLIIKNIDISGTGNSNGWSLQVSNIFITGVDGITLDGIVGNGHFGSKKQHRHGININTCQGNIEVKNCTLYNWGPSDLPAAHTTDDHGLYIRYDPKIGEQNPNATVKVHHNVIYQTNADSLQIAGFKGGRLEIYSNTFYKHGENAIDLKSVSNAKIYDNVFYRGKVGDSFYGRGGSASGGGTEIIIHDSSSKWQGLHCYDNEIYDNYFHTTNHGGVGLLGLSVRTKVYRNRFRNVNNAILLSNAIEDSEIYDNLIYNAEHWSDPQYAIEVLKSWKRNTRVYNNTIYDKGNYISGIKVEGSSDHQGTVIMNNIVVASKSASYPLIYDNTGNAPSISYNCWYHTTNSNRVLWGAKEYSSSQLQDWLADHSSGDLFSDPDFKNPQSWDFSLSNNSPCLLDDRRLGAIITTIDIDGDSVELSPPANLVIIG